jgi:cytoskeleton protein RodZ
MSSTPFGEHLRREREMRGVSLDEIAVATRISTRFLEALEREQWDQLPGGAFNRGFIRSIARFLGIDEDGLVAEYAYGHESANGKPRTAVPSDRIPRNYRPAIAAAALVVLLIAGGIGSLEHYGSRIMAGIHNRFAVGAAARDTTGVPIWANPVPASIPRASSPVSSTSRTADPFPLAPTPAAPDLALTVTATRRAEVSVAADGRTAFAGKLRTNQAKRFEARDTIEVASSKPAALELTLNGHPISWTGVPNNPRKMMLTRAGLVAPAEPSH